MQVNEQEKREAELMARFREAVPMKDNDEPTSTLFHYTDAAGLLGILKKRAIRATHYAHLNDPAEVVHAEELIGRTLDHLCDSRDDTFPKDAFRRLKDKWSDSKPSSYGEIYVASFCDDGGDRLSQWRAYGCGGSGYALGFRKIFLGDDQGPGFVNLLKVSYALEEDRAMMQAIELFKSVAIFGQRLAEERSGSKSDVLNATSAYLEEVAVNLVVRSKHGGFSEESEWRILAIPYLTKGTIRHRATRRGIIPFVSVPLAQPNAFPDLHEICIGPLNGASASADAVRSLLRSLNYPSVPVRLSGTPFRQ